MSLQRRINKRHREGMTADQRYGRHMDALIAGRGGKPNYSLADWQLQQRIAERLRSTTPRIVVDEFAQAGTAGGGDNRGRWGEWIGPNHPEKGKENGRCNRTACQRPLKDEPTHQFMRDWMTTNGRLYYCAKCARDFDDWDYRSGDVIRISREPKTCEVA